MTITEINKYIATEIMGKCVHKNVSRNADDPLIIECSDCDRSLTQQEYTAENWDCRHSEKEPKGGSTRVCKYCGADDVSFDVAPPRPDYCSDDSPRSLLNEVVAKVIDLYKKSKGDIALPDYFYLNQRSPAEQIARACVAAHQEAK